MNGSSHDLQQWSGSRFAKGGCTSSDEKKVLQRRSRRSFYFSALQFVLPSGPDLDGSFSCSLLIWNGGGCGLEPAIASAGRCLACVLSANLAPPSYPGGVFLSHDQPSHDLSTGTNRSENVACLAS